MRSWILYLAIGGALVLAYFAANYGLLGLYQAIKCDRPGYVFRPMIPPSDNRC
jgi:hypothetical protein